MEYKKTYKKSYGKKESRKDESTDVRKFEGQLKPLMTEAEKKEAQVLEYKSWLSSETIAQIEKIRNANLMSVVISMTNPVLQEALDNEGSRGVLASEVYDMWEVAKGIKV